MNTNVCVDQGFVLPQSLLLLSFVVMNANTVDNSKQINKIIVMDLEDGGPRQKLSDAHFSPLVVFQMVYL